MVSWEIASHSICNCSSSSTSLCHWPFGNIILDYPPKVSYRFKSRLWAGQSENSIPDLRVIGGEARLEELGEVLPTSFSVVSPVSHFPIPSSHTPDQVTGDKLVHPSFLRFLLGEKELK